MLNQAAASCTLAVFWNLVVGSGFKALVPMVVGVVFKSFSLGDIEPHGGSIGGTLLRGATLGVRPRMTGRSR